MKNKETTSIIFGLDPEIKEILLRGLAYLVKNRPCITVFKNVLSFPIYPLRLINWTFR